MDCVQVTRNCGFHALFISLLHMAQILRLPKHFSSQICTQFLICCLQLIQYKKIKPEYILNFWRKQISTLKLEHWIFVFFCSGYPRHYVNVAQSSRTYWTYTPIFHSFQKIMKSFCQIFSKKAPTPLEKLSLWRSLSCFRMSWRRPNYH
jgi:hypothetical protein